METAIIIIIVGLAAFFMGRRLYRTIKRGGTCGCGGGTSSCSLGKTGEKIER